MKWRIIPFAPQYEISENKEIRDIETQRILPVLTYGDTASKKIRGYVELNKKSYNVQFCYNAAFFEETDTMKFVPNTDYKYVFSLGGDLYNVKRDFYKYQTKVNGNGEKYFPQLSHTSSELKEIVFGITDYDTNPKYKEIDIDSIQYVQVRRDSGLLEKFTIDEFKLMCGNDERMIKDYIIHIKNHPISTYSNGVWTIV